MRMFMTTARRALSVTAAVALLAGCARTEQLQYQTSVQYQPPVLDPTSEKCRALQAVIEDRERYGIIASSRGMDEVVLGQCGLPHSSGGGPPYTPTATVTPGVAIAPETLQDEVRLELHKGVFAVPVVINGAISIPFVLDSGSADVQLPAEVIFTLMRTGTLSEKDFIGESSYVLADGSTARGPRFNIREMRVGKHVVRNVTASAGPAISSDALLGQSFLSRVGSWTLDNGRHVLVLAR